MLWHSTSLHPIHTYSTRSTSVRCAHFFVGHFFTPMEQTCMKRFPSIVLITLDMIKGKDVNWLLASCKDTVIKRFFSSSVCVCWRTWHRPKGPKLDGYEHWTKNAPFYFNDFFVCYSFSCCCCFYSCHSSLLFLFVFAMVLRVLFCAKWPQYRFFSSATAAARSQLLLNGTENRNVFTYSPWNDILIYTCLLCLGKIWKTWSKPENAFFFVFLRCTLRILFTILSFRWLVLLCSGWWGPMFGQKWLRIENTITHCA